MKRIIGRANNKVESDKQQNTSQTSEANTKIIPKVKRVGGCGCGKRRTL